MSTLTGRDRELDIIMRSVSDDHAVVILGDAGIGKSTLLRAATGEIERAGRRVVRVVGTSTTRAIPFGALAGVLAMVDPAPPDQRLIEAVRLLRGHHPLAPVLAVDDAHLLDDHTSALVLASAVQGHTVVCMTARTDESAPDTIRRFWKDEFAQVVTLGPLDERGAAALVEARVGAPIDTRTHDRLFRTTGGHPLALCELVDAGMRDASFIDLGGVLAWCGDLRAGPALADLLDGRLDRLDAGARACAELLAIAGPVPLPLALAVCGADAIDAVVSNGVARRCGAADTPVVEFAHPLYGPVIAAHVQAAEARAVIVQLVASAAQIGPRDAESQARLAAWLVQLGDRSQPSVLATAGRRAFDSGELPLAQHLLRAAVDAGAGGEAEAVLNRIDSILGSGPMGEPDPTEPDAIMQAAISEHDRFVIGAAHRDAALDAITGAIERLREPAKRAELAAVRLLVRAHAGENVTQLVEEGDAIAHSNADAMVTVRLALALGPALVAMGRVDDGIVLLERGLDEVDPAGASGFVREQLVSSLLQALAFAGRVLEAEQRASALYEEAIRNDRPSAVLAAALPLGQIDLWRGRPHTATRRLGEALARMAGFDLVGYVGWCRAHLGWALAWTGRASDPHNGKGPDSDGGFASEPAAPGWAGALLAPVTWTALAQRELMCGRLSRAESFAHAGADRAAAAGQSLLAASALHVAARIRPGKATAAQVAGFARGCQGALAPLLVQSAVALADDDPTALEGAAGRCAQLGLTALAHEHWLRAAHAHARADAPAAARRCGSEALDVASSMEAVPSAISEGTTPVRLTTREREVAFLASRGRTNTEIATELGTSVRTVHTHLQAAYRKLGVNRRDQLAGFLV